MTHDNGINSDSVLYGPYFFSWIAVDWNEKCNARIVTSSFLFKKMQINQVDTNIRPCPCSIWDSPLLSCNIKMTEWQSDTCKDNPVRVPCYYEMHILTICHYSSQKQDKCRILKMYNAQAGHDRMERKYSMCFSCCCLARDGLLWKVSQLRKWAVKFCETYKHTVGSNICPLIHAFTHSRTNETLCRHHSIPTVCTVMTISSAPFSVNNMAAPTCHADPPYQLHLEEHWVRKDWWDISIHCMRKKARARRGWLIRN